MPCPKVVHRMLVTYFSLSSKYYKPSHYRLLQGPYQKIPKAGFARLKYIGNVMRHLLPTAMPQAYRTSCRDRG